jgi:tryptophan 2,3-dioxygenase
MEKPYPPVYYADYLELDRLLDSQHRKSEEYGAPAHDEMLFIVVHQAYELWFKQILFELESVIGLFEKDRIDERSIGVAVSRLMRVTEIQKILIDQLRVLETMTPLDFLEFRDYLVPASGFQSYQFRLIENRLGLQYGTRLSYNQAPYYSRLSPEHQKLLQESDRKPSLFVLVEKWLERTPFLEFGHYNFWATYREAVERMLGNDRAIIENNPTLGENEKSEQLRQLRSTEENFEALFDQTRHDELVRQGVRRLSYRATEAALLICLYRDQPILHLPFRLVTTLVDIDELFTTWRYRHTLMVHRMIGTKIGTGGSSGHQYLRETTERHKVFVDFFNLSTFLIPRSRLPKLPDEIEKNLGFFYGQD